MAATMPLESADTLVDCANRLDYILSTLSWAAYGQELTLSDTAATGLAAILLDVATELRRACAA